MKKERQLTCIVCPRGCSLRVTLEDLKVISVEGQGCNRGKVYAENECTHPVRTLTSTVRLTNEEVVAVKTDRAIPKEKIFDAMREVNRLRPSAPVKAGQVLICGLLGEEANLIATADSKEK